MARIPLAKMTDEAIEQEIAELEANPRPVQGTFTRIENLRAEKLRRLQSRLLDTYKDLNEINELKTRLDICKSLDEINELKARLNRLKGR